MKSYAVIFTYSFDNDVAVYLFDTEEEAKQFLKDNYDEEIRIDTEENGFDSHGYIEDDGWYAKIFCRENDEAYVNTTTMRIGRVYL